MTDTNRTASELLFEEYLASHGYTMWRHEAPVEGKRKNPDYRLEHNGGSLFFEVKEFNTSLPTGGFGAYDPYVPIREKINQATREFKEYKEFPCSVVVASPKPTFVQLAEPWAIMGAMLGNLGFRFPLGGNPSEGEQVFVQGGKMINDKRQEPQNTTISAVIVLATYPLREKQIRTAIKKRQQEFGRGTTLEEELEFYEAIADARELRRVRVIVYENPYARIPLVRDLFGGPFDERWGVDGEFIRRVSVGADAARIEATLSDE